jgi:S1/P1 Nuclease
MSSNNLPANNPVSEVIDPADLVKPDTGLFDSEFWAVSRHELIADVAEQLLKPATANSLKKVLKPLSDQGFPTALADLAGWADLTKHRGPNEDDDEFTVEFLEDPANKSRAIWHYVDLPLGAERYSRELYPTLTAAEDVVQIAKEAVRVLKGESERFNEINALRLVVHLIGDLHQPVHVGCGYVDESGAVPKLVFDPEKIVQKGFQDDQGGNHIILPVGTNGAKLHEYWDSRLGGPHPDISGDGEGDAVTITPELKKAFTNKLLQMIAADPPPPSSDAPAEGDATSIDDWIEEWANDSLAAAREAYKSIKITGPNGNAFDVTWEGKPAYDSRCKPIALERMKSAARNLAAVLDEIYA